MRVARRFGLSRLIFTLLAAAAAGPVAAAEPPVTIGFSMALTGGLAVNGKPGLLAMQIWEEDINAKGGLLGRPVKLVYYDDQSNPATVPGIYSKLLDVDKVDLIVSPYATNMVAPLMPTAIQRNLTVLSLFATAVNDEFHYHNYFSMLPLGPHTKLENSRGFFDAAMTMDPKPKTVAILAADAEYAQNTAAGAREHIKSHGLKIVYDSSYPPSTVEFSSILRAVQAANPDLVFIGAYPSDAVAIVRAANEIGLKTRQFGGTMVGLQSTTIRMQLGPLLNGLVSQDWWVPVPKLMFPGTKEFLEKYQARAPAAGVDPLGYFMPPYSYARMQVLAEAVEGAKSLDPAKLSQWLHANEVHSIIGNFRFGPEGEWAAPRVLTVQYQGIKGNDVEQFRNANAYVLLSPQELRSPEAKFIYPYEEAHKK
jgi:branched-chain amino acid transport system substrate-binding protein